MRRLVLLALCAPSLLAAQVLADSAKPVAHARVWFRDGGELVRRTQLLAPIGDTIVVRGALGQNGPLTTLRMPMASVARLEHRVGLSRSARARQGARTGAVVGLVIGVALTARAIGWRDPDADDAPVGTMVFAAGSIASTLIGAAAGALLGSTQGSQWVCVPDAPCEAKPPQP